MWNSFAKIVTRGANRTFLPFEGEPNWPLENLESYLRSRIVRVDGSKREPADDADKDAFAGRGRGARQARSERRSCRGRVHVCDVAQGGKALSELEADPSRFSGLITDVRLGRGPDGWEIARRAREPIPNLPVVYISGHGSADWASKGVPNSLTLSKPFATAQLITAISTLLVEADAHKAREG